MHNCPTDIIAISCYDFDIILGLIRNTNFGGLSMFSHYSTHGWGAIEADDIMERAGYDFEPEITGLKPNSDIVAFNKLPDHY